MRKQEFDRGGRGVALIFLYLLGVGVTKPPTPLPSVNVKLSTPQSIEKIFMITWQL